MAKKNIIILAVSILLVFASGVWLIFDKENTESRSAERTGSEPVSEEKAYYVGILPLENPTVMVERMSRTEKYLREKTGMNIKFKYYPTTGAVGGYTAAVRDVVNGNTAFAFLAPVTIVQANGVSNGAVVPFACGQKQGSPIYYGHIAVKADSPYQKIQDLRGKMVCGSSKSSTSGNLLPTAYLLSLGIDKYEYFSKMEFLGSHDKATEAVIAGTWDAAFINETTFDKWNKDGVQLRSLYRHPAVPEFPWSVNTDVVKPAELAKVKQALLSMHEADLEGIQKTDSKYEKWVAINWEDYSGTKESVDLVYGPVFYDLEEWDKMDE